MRRANPADDRSVGAARHETPGRGTTAAVTPAYHLQLEVSNSTAPSAVTTTDGGFKVALTSDRSKRSSVSSVSSASTDSTGGHASSSGGGGGRDKHTSAGPSTMTVAS